MWRWILSLGSADKAEQEHVHIGAIVEDTIGLDDLNLRKLADAPTPVLGE